jgi:hypothetical protein
MRDLEPFGMGVVDIFKVGHFNSIGFTVTNTAVLE